MFRWLVIPGVVHTLCAQAQAVPQQAEFWAAYIGTVRVAERWSIWQDYHLVPGAFGAARSGVAFRPRPDLQLVAGHAWLWTSTAFDDRLTRGELRPWAQMLHQFTRGGRWNGQVRFRYDARFRERIAEGRVIDGEYVFNHRLRGMVSMRWRMAQRSNGDPFHLTVMDEVLYNCGANVRDGIDQNRVFVLPGYTHGPYTVMVGYHLRMIRSAPMVGPATLRYNHGLTVWFLHTIDIRHRLKRHSPVTPPLPHGG